ncbi:hypothetical protein DFH09DRAFT_1302072 [Mycena vulgaris]|nr:hypothetical protein DFH09DRAFT_1302072 [Mycena vulgaris]
MRFSLLTVAVLAGLFVSSTHAVVIRQWSAPGSSGALRLLGAQRSVLQYRLLS